MPAYRAGLDVVRWAEDLHDYLEKTIIRDTKILKGDDGNRAPMGELGTLGEPEWQYTFTQIAPGDTLYIADSWLPGFVDVQLDPTTISADTNIVMPDAIPGNIAEIVVTAPFVIQAPYGMYIRDVDMNVLETVGVMGAGEHGRWYRAICTDIGTTPAWRIVELKNW